MRPLISLCGVIERGVASEDAYATAVMHLAAAQKLATDYLQSVGYVATTSTLSSDAASLSLVYRADAVSPEILIGTVSALANAVVLQAVRVRDKAGLREIAALLPDVCALAYFTCRLFAVLKVLADGDLEYYLRTLWETGRSPSIGNVSLTRVWDRADYAAALLLIGAVSPIITAAYREMSSYELPR